MLALLLACAPADVHLVCTDEAPLCDTLEVLEDPRPTATGVSLTGMAVYGPVEQRLVVDGELSHEETVVPMIEGRDVMVRLLVTVDPDFEGRELTGRVFFYDGGELLAAYQGDADISGDSSWDNLSSSINVHVSGAALRGDLTIGAEIVERGPKIRAAGAEGTPRAGPVELSFQPVGDSLRIQVVPIQYDADGSGRLPDTSDEQIALYEQYMYWMYPTPDVEVTVGDVLVTDTTVSPNGNGWDTLLSELAEARTAQGVDPDVYLYGLFEPDTDEGTFCAAGCVAGLSSQALSAGDSYSRASIGLGFTGTDSAATMAHEVGHAHGRDHSPGCGAAGADPDYPDEDGYLDYRGYDALNDGLQETDVAYDIMSYCTPSGMSAFTQAALADRIAEVNETYAADRRHVETWRSMWVHADGSLVWGVDRPMTAPPQGQTRWVVARAKGHEARIPALYAPFADLPGGTLVFRDPGFRVEQITLDGVTSPAAPGSPAAP